MKRLRSTRIVILTSLLGLMALGMSVTAGPAAAVVIPSVDGPTPMSGPTATAIPVRIYGSGFTGATAVKFGTLSSSSFSVIDDKLITAMVPTGGTNNTLVSVSVTNSAGTGSAPSAYYFTNAGFTATTSPSPAVPGANMTATVTAYKPNTPVIFPEFNPLMLYLEGGPAFPAGPPPYAQTMGNAGGTTNAVTGNLTWSHTLPNPFAGTNGSAYDANIQCPVNQTTANYLGDSPPASLNKPSYSGKCHMAVNKLGSMSLETPLTYSTDPTPAAPTVTISPTTATKGTTVSITAGANWNANPFFGSTVAASRPGETAVEVKICGLGGVSTNCSTTVSSNAAVAMTRYTSTSTTMPITATFSGATLSGSIVVGNDVSPCSCTVRVRQYRTGSSTNYIEKTAALTVN